MDIQAVRDEMLSIARARFERYREMVRLAEDKKTVLVEGRHAELPEIVDRFDPILLELAQLDKREAMLSKHVEQLDLGAGSVVTPEYETIQAQTRRLALELRELTHINMILLDNAMQFVNFSIGVLSKVAADSQPSEGGNPAIVFDTKV